MNITDWIGSIGVAILLIAFLLNLLNRLSKDGFVYILMNVIGAGLACYASILLNYMPFIILEGCWALVSVYSLLKLLNSK
jgi:hypothetical protein